MPIDFTEIPSPTTPGGRDDFELFARAFLEAAGLHVVQGPARGADGGQDLIVEEAVGGPISKSTRRWLVSCKHFAASDRSVGPSEEQNIGDRTRQHRADGFIGFYSTIPHTLHLIFDRDRIEARLRSGEPAMQTVFRHYLPKSYAATRALDETLCRVFTEHVPLPCDKCGRDVLVRRDVDGTPRHDAVVLFVWDRETRPHDHAVALGVACIGECETAVHGSLWEAYKLCPHASLIDAWSTPRGYLLQQLTVMDDLRSGDTYSDEAFERLQQIVAAVSQRALRGASADDAREYQQHTELGVGFGGR
jgi:hypothetical protein